MEEDAGTEAEEEVAADEAECAATTALMTFSGGGNRDVIAESGRDEEELEAGAEIDEGGITVK